MGAGLAKSLEVARFCENEEIGSSMFMFDIEPRVHGYPSRCPGGDGSDGP